MGVRPGTSRYRQQDLGGVRLPQGSSSWFPSGKNGCEGCAIDEKTYRVPITAAGSCQ